MGRDALPVGRDRSGDPPRGPGGIVKPFMRTGKGREALPEGWEGLGGPLGGPGGAEWPSWRPGRGG